MSNIKDALFAIGILIIAGELVVGSFFLFVWMIVNGYIQ